MVVVWGPLRLILNVVYERSLEDVANWVATLRVTVWSNNYDTG